MVLELLPIALRLDLRGLLDADGRLAVDIFLGDRGYLEILALQRHDGHRDPDQVCGPLLVGDAVIVQFRLVVADFPPTLVTGQDECALDLIAAEIAFELAPEVVEALHGPLGADVVVVAAECNRALALPSGRLDLAQLLLAAHGLDGFVENGVRARRVSAAAGAAQGKHESYCQHRTDDPCHEITSPCERKKGKQVSLILCAAASPDERPLWARAWVYRRLSGTARARTRSS